MPGFISVISVCTWDEVYVIDPIYELWNDINTTFKTKFLENPNILKVFHNMDNDVLLGQTTLQTYMTGVVDLNHMFQIYKMQNPDECFILMRPILKELEAEKSKKKRKPTDLSDSNLRNILLTLDKIAYDKVVNAFYGKQCKLQKELRRSDWRVRPLGDLVDYSAKDAYYLLGLFHLILQKVIICSHS